MKRLIIFLLLLSLIYCVSADFITGEASNDNTNVSVFVLPGKPVINIFSPMNFTYYTQNIFFNYSIKNSPSHAWYNIDDSENISLSSFSGGIPLTLSLGTHTLYLYSNNTQGFSFETISFEVKETPYEPSPANNGGSNGGGGGTITTQTILLDKELIEASIEKSQASTDTESFSITNNAQNTLNINFEVISENNLISFSESSFSLAPKQTKKIEVYFSSPNFPQGIYSGKILITAGAVQRELNFVLTVKDTESLFDLSVKIPERYKIIPPSGKVDSVIEMINLFFAKSSVNVDFHLYITDFERSMVQDVMSEKIAVQDVFSTSIDFTMSPDFPEGTYMLVGDLQYGNFSASSYDTFKISKEDRSKFYLRLGALLALILLLIAAILHIKKDLYW